MFIYISVQIILFQIFFLYFKFFNDQSETLGNCINSIVESHKFLGTRDFISNYQYFE